MVSDTATHGVEASQTPAVSLEVAVREKRILHKQMADILGETAAEVQTLRAEVAARSRMAEDRQNEWLGVQRECSELVMQVVRDTAGLGRQGAHRLRAMIDVLRRDETRLSADIARLAQIHAQEDSNFRTQRHALDAEKAASDSMHMTNVHSAASSTQKACDHMARVAALSLELQALNDNYCDDILSHAKSVFLVM